MKQFPLLCAFFFCAGLPFSSEAGNVKKYLDLVVTFQSGAVGLDARERARIADILQRIRNEDWCPLHWAVVVGQLRPDHEKSAASHRLIERRAVYVSGGLSKFLPNTLLNVIFNQYVFRSRRFFINSAKSEFDSSSASRQSPSMMGLLRNNANDRRRFFLISPEVKQ